ncbi:MAG: hypothetical protein ACP5VS_13610 [Desulfomonilaceae bacterium]
MKTALKNSPTRKEKIRGVGASTKVDLLIDFLSDLLFTRNQIVF